ncbi:MAG: hypothetical protein ACI4R8_04730 [Candidatus Caccovivens sp.]
MNINNIENVEGKYHLMFLEGKNVVEKAKNDLRYTWFSLLLFTSLVLVFIIISGFNLFYVGFIVVFLIFFIVMLVYLLRTKRKGMKQCIYAVTNSQSSEIVAKQVDKRNVNKAVVKDKVQNLDKNLK